MLNNFLTSMFFSFTMTVSNSVDVKYFPVIFKQRVIDCFIQEWNGTLNTNRVLEEYKYSQKRTSMFVL